MKLEETVSDQQQMEQKCQLAFATAQDKLRHLVAMYPNYFPMVMQLGKWMHSGETWTN